MLPVTLSLLQGPTKALVTSAVGWGAAGAALLAASPNPALCYVPRLAYDADVFEVRGAHALPWRPAQAF